MYSGTMNRMDSWMGCGHVILTFDVSQKLTSITTNKNHLSSHPHNTRKNANLFNKLLT